MPKFSSAVPKDAGKFLDAAGKRGLIGQRLVIQRLRHDPNHTYKGKQSPRWVVSVSTNDGELFALSFGSNDFRDSMFRTIADMIADEQPIDPVTLVYVEPDKGSAFWTFEDWESDSENDSGDSNDSAAKPQKGKA